jgi:hypothetical protein
VLVAVGGNSLYLLPVRNGRSECNGEILDFSKLRDPRHFDQAVSGATMRPAAEGNGQGIGERRSGKIVSSVEVAAI